MSLSSSKTDWASPERAVETWFPDVCEGLGLQGGVHALSWGIKADSANGGSSPRLTWPLM